MPCLSSQAEPTGGPPGGRTTNMRNDNNESASLGRLGRRGVLECMTWAGTAMVWTMVGGVPRARLIGSAAAATTDFCFVQISDSHLGFDKPVNPYTTATFAAAL